MFLSTQLGHVSQDPVMRATQSGMNILNFSVASNDRRQKGSQPIFMQWSLFGKQAEALAPHLYKGMKVLVVGRLQMNSWAGADGQTKSGLQGVATNIELLSPPRGAPTGPPPPQGPAPTGYPPQQQPIQSHIPQYPPPSPPQTTQQPVQYRQPAPPQNQNQQAPMDDYEPPNF